MDLGHAATRWNNAQRCTLLVVAPKGLDLCSAGSIAVLSRQGVLARDHKPASSLLSDSY